MAIANREERYLQDSMGPCPNQQQALCADYIDVMPSIQTSTKPATLYLQDPWDSAAPAEAHMRGKCVEMRSGLLVEVVEDNSVLSELAPPRSRLRAAVAALWGLVVTVLAATAITSAGMVATDHVWIGPRGHIFSNGSTTYLGVWQRETCPFNTTLWNAIVQDWDYVIDSDGSQTCSVEFVDCAGVDGTFWTYVAGFIAPAQVAVDSYQCGYTGSWCSSLQVFSALTIALMSLGTIAAMFSSCYRVAANIAKIFYGFGSILAVFVWGTFSYTLTGCDWLDLALIGDSTDVLPGVYTVNARYTYGFPMLVVACIMSAIAVCIVQPFPRNL